MLLTHPAVDGVAPGAARLAAAAALPLALFVGYHLVNPQEHARRTFWDARFLALAGAPGQVQSCDGLRHLTLLCRACMMAPSPSQPAPGSTSVMAVPLPGAQAQRSLRWGLPPLARVQPELRLPCPGGQLFLQGQVQRPAGRALRLRKWELN